MEVMKDLEVLGMSSQGETSQNECKNNKELNSASQMVDRAGSFSVPPELELTDKSMRDREASNGSLCHGHLKTENCSAKDDEETHCLDGCMDAESLENGNHSDDVTSGSHKTGQREQNDYCNVSDTAEDLGQDIFCKAEVSETYNLVSDDLQQRIKDSLGKNTAEIGNVNLMNEILDFFEGETDSSIVDHGIVLNQNDSQMYQPCGHLNSDSFATVAPPDSQISFGDNINLPNSILALSFVDSNADSSLIQSEVRTCNSESTVNLHLSSSENTEISNETVILAQMQSKTSFCSPGEDPAEDELLAELENEFYSTSENHTSVGNAAESIPDYKALKSKFDALQRRLEHTLGQRKDLEVENMRLEQKLVAAFKSTDNIKQELESVITAQHQEADALKQKLVMVEEKGKQELLDLQAEHCLKVEQLTKLHEDCLKEKDGVVVRYAQAEQKNIDVQDRLQKAEARVKEWTREREIALVKWHAMKSDIKKSTELNQTLTSEVTSLKKEAERHKDAASSAEVKLKWHQNKIKVEQDTNKDLKAKIQDLEDKLKELKKEELITLDQIKLMFIVLQELDDGRTPVEITQKKDTSTVDEILPIIRKGLRLLEMKARELVVELQTFRDKVRCLEVERLSQEESLSTMRDSLHSHQQCTVDLRDRLLRLEKTEHMLKECEKQLNLKLVRVDELESSNCDLTTEIDRLRKRETEQLEFTSRISEKNTQLQAENSKLLSEIATAVHSSEELSSLCTAMECQNQKLEEEKNKLAEDVGHIQAMLEVEQGKLSNASLKLEEAEDEMKTMKRRHASNIKDLTRQLQMANRRVAEVKEPAVTGKTDRDSASLGSLGSHGGSSGSLDTAGLTALGSNESTMQCEEGRDQSKQALVDRITSLEKVNRRKCEKIEFLKDHVDQLIEELHRKSRLIQDYVLREEAGSLVPEASDMNKALLAKKGGIMASLYASHALDGSMTMGLSLEINQKLQALLEDTLFKNIKLKEGMETLGQEIDWLSRENKQLQLELERTANQSAS